MSQYNLSDDDKANAATFNKIHNDLDLRLKNLEKLDSAINQATDKLVELGLAKINPAVDQALAALDNVSELSNLFRARSLTSVEISLGVTEFIIEPDDRPNFVVTKYLVVYIDGQLDKWMAGQEQGWNQETGQLLINITNLRGEGVFDDWVVTTTSIPDTGPSIDAYNKTETDSAIATAKSEAVAQTKNELLNGAGAAFDTFVELQSEIEGNDSALLGLAASVDDKASASHTHAISNVTGLQDVIDTINTDVSAAANYPVMHLQDKSATVGQVLGSGWNVRVWNNVVRNDIPGGSFNPATERVMLAAGTYRVKAWASAYKPTLNQLILWDATNGVELLVGMVCQEHVSYLGQVQAILMDEFTLTETIEFDLRHTVQHVGYSSLAGYATATVHATMIIERIG